MRLPVLIPAMILIACFASHEAHAQSFATSPCTDDSRSGSNWFGGSERACELRRTTLPLGAGHLGVTGENGNIEVIGEDRSDIALEARVSTQAGSHADADALLHQIEIRTAGDDIRAEGPEGGMSSLWSHRSWSVSYKLRVPRRMAQTALHTSNGHIKVSSLEGEVSAGTTNGAIEATRVHGNLRATSTNGSLELTELSGAVHAQTTNGHVQIALNGDRWRGDGIDVHATNGGITLHVPQSFAAHLIAATTNGSIHLQFPVDLVGKMGHHLDTNLNGGGPEVRLETTNGGITLDRLES